jgi:hypothetical protein
MIVFIFALDVCLTALSPRWPPHPDDTEIIHDGGPITRSGTPPSDRATQWLITTQPRA